MSSFFKSFAGNPREAAAMAMVQSSSYRVLSGKSCSNLRRNTPLDSFLAKGRSSVKAFSFLYVSRFSTEPNNEFGHSSKRRSRGPVMAAKKASEGEKQEDGKYKQTVDLPKTGFGMRANSLTREPELQKLWEENQVFKRVSDNNNGGSFILHDGPPYANGDLHMGHALNKILKDIINRYKLLQNYKVQYVPGWDCHGLPIELKVLQFLDQEVRKELTPLKLRAKAAKFAKATVKTQMESFKRFGVWADWNNPYLTLDPEYEAAQIEVFGQMALKGYIYRGRKPVHWSPSSRTALAEAELEYPEGHISKSIYAIFKLVGGAKTSLLDEFIPNIYLAVWTTTPWTMPANAAVAVNAKLQYSVVEVQSFSEDESTVTSNKKKIPGKVLKNQQKLFVIVATDPIPAFYHVKTKEPLMNEETINHVKSIISQKGSDAWWYMSVEDLLPEKYRDKAADYEKGTDTMDVWFDSGSSWAGVLGKREGLSFPADVYLEGTDQHRGWFQSSLLTSIATQGKAPYSAVITHGFVLDEKGMKMSKSLGNVVDPRLVIEGGKNSKDAPAYGADVMRLWVSSVDYTGDVLIGPQILRQMSDIYRKLRGTLRYLLGNLHDWRVDNAVPYQDLPIIDQHALFQLENVVKNIQECYENYQFFKIFQIIQRFTIVDLSNFYFDIAKDRLYTGGTSSFTRRSCQTVLSTHLLSILRVIAPIVPHLAEDVWQNLPFEYRNEDGSAAEFVFELKWPTLNEQWLSFPAEDVLFWQRLLELRTEVNKVLELARNEKMIGSSLEAKVYLHTADAGMAAKLLEMSEAKNEADTLQRIFITSQVEVLSSMEKEMISSVQHTGEYVEGENKVWIGVSRAEGSKCERCWNYSGQVGSFSDHPTLCGRCFSVIVANPPEPAVAAVNSLA